MAGDRGSTHPAAGACRLENLHDGIKDYECFWLLENTVSKLRKAGVREHRSLIDTAVRVLAVDEAVVTDLTHFTDDPQVLRQARAALARLIERAPAVDRGRTL